MRKANLLDPVEAQIGQHVESDLCQELERHQLYSGPDQLLYRARTLLFTLTVRFSGTVTIQELENFG